MAYLHVCLNNQCYTCTSCAQMYVSSMTSEHGRLASACQAARNMHKSCLQTVAYARSAAAHSVMGWTGCCPAKQRLLLQQVKSCCPVLQGLSGQLSAWQRLHSYHHRHCRSHQHHRIAVLPLRGAWPRWRMSSADAVVQTVAAIFCLQLLTAWDPTPCRHQVPAAPAAAVPPAALAAAHPSLPDPQLPDQFPGLHHPPPQWGRVGQGPGAGVQKGQPGPTLQAHLGDPSWWTSARGGY